MTRKSRLTWEQEEPEKTNIHLTISKQYPTRSKHASLVRLVPSRCSYSFCEYQNQKMILKRIYATFFLRMKDRCRVLFEQRPFQSRFSHDLNTTFHSLNQSYLKSSMSQQPYINRLTCYTEAQRSS